MSKPKINFRYDSGLSPRSVTELQKGPLKINSLIDSLNNPQYEQLRLKSSQQIEQSPVKIAQKKNANDEDTSILNDRDKTVKKDLQIAPNASRAPQKNGPKEPKRQQSRIKDEKQLRPLNEKKPINPASQEKQAKPQNQQNPINPTNSEKLIKPNHEEMSIKPTNDQKNQSQVQQLPLRPKYTFTIAPPPPLKKSDPCCNLFGWCKKQEKQRTYPIND